MLVEVCVGKCWCRFLNVGSGFCGNVGLDYCWQCWFRFLLAMLVNVFVGNFVWIRFLLAMLDGLGFCCQCWLD
jgi:hypothetical protein